MKVMLLGKIILRAERDRGMGREYNKRLGMYIEAIR